MENNERKINWFPGHMAKALRQMEADAKLCDGVILVMDARAVFACFNKRLDKIFGSKPVVYCINKRDLISTTQAKKIESYFKQNNLVYELIDGLSKRDGQNLRAKCDIALKEKIERNAAKGVNRTLRFMVAGLPNTGKSTIINTISGSKKTETGNKAGITRSNKWIRLGNFDLLDTPGTMPPNIENQTYARHLAYIGAINDDILHTEDLALELIKELAKIAPSEFKEKYKLDSLDKEPLALFDEICKKRGYLLRGGESDYERAAKAIIDDFRKGRIGKIALETEPVGNREKPAEKENN